MSYGPGYACASCKTMLRPRTNEIYVAVESDGQAYQIWCADLWECPDCGTQIILGYGQRPLSENYQDGFEKYLKMVTHNIDGKLKALT